jgi:hypothetical protein
METGTEAPQTQGTETGGGEPDIMSFIGHTARTAQEAHTTANKQADVLSRLEKVFSKAEPAPDGWYDDVLKTALEAEKAGQPIPLTVKISTELRNSQMANQKLMQEIEEMKAKMAIKENPNYNADQMAFNQMDSFLGQELQRTYGEQIPKAIAGAVTQDLVTKIQEEQRTNPERWKQIRSNPQMMRRVIQNAVANVVPQRAKEIAYEEQQRNAVYEPDEIMENIREAQELLHNEEVRNNPRAAQRVNESIEKMRAMYWEAVIPGQGRKARI